MPIDLLVEYSDGTRKFYIPNESFENQTRIKEKEQV
jgi:hypothetical protein